ncbi:hypothetical protein CWI84_08635 [Idiomarina tyrosinivorans]|uniref:TonB-dependent receptor n=1 Tax=Idiomarina tyrosinivorans TaxID=1445662 RepID=A0A432ZQB1_9GAMM|nr:TonB-dependent receptor [Idiomarina tyrosinivorans]RUO80016.1 hypothetical protein CWI84_08635 [Idiomarina tyrosinivorans]
MLKYTPIATLVALFCCSPALATDDDSNKHNKSTVEHLLVTGDLQQRELHEIPQSVQLISREEMARRNATQLQDVLNTAANVNFAGGTSTARFIQIRGIGERSQFVDPINPSVGLLIDGIDYSGLGSVATLFDIGHMEIFRGPQSGRFGTNALAGMVLLESEAASEDFRGRWHAGVANYGEREAGLALGGSLGALGLARFSVNQFKQDGFIENRYLERDDTNDRDELTLRFNLTSQLTKDWALDTTVHYSNIDNGYDAFSLDNDRTTLSDEPGFDRVESEAVRLGLSYQGFADSELLFAVTGLHADLGYAFDEDWTYVGIAPGWEYSSFDAYYRDRDDRSAELRWTSKQPAQLFGLATDWVFGAYHYQQDTALTRDYYNWDLDQPSVFNSDYQVRRNALYGELAQHISDKTTLITGLRVERYDNDYQDSRSITANPKDTMWGGNISLRHDVNERSSVYLTVAKGYKAGGVNGEALGKAQDQGLTEITDYLLSRATFQPEVLWSTEFGVKGQSADGQLRASISAFYQWRDDVQLKSWVNREQSFVGYIENAAEGNNYGIEASISRALSDNWRWFANLGWLETEIDGFVTEDGIDMSGRDQAHAPNYQFSTGIEGWLTEHLQWSVSVDGKDGFYFSNSHNQQAKQTRLLNTQLSYHWQQLTLRIWARNLTDEDYAIRGFYFGNDPRKQYVTETYKQFGEPRRFGVSLDYAF